LVSTGNHERTGLEGATENGSGCPVREPWVRWARFPSSGFESSVDERSKWCTIIDMIDTDRRLCRPEGRTHREAASRWSLCRNAGDREVDTGEPGCIVIVHEIICGDLIFDIEAQLELAKGVSRCPQERMGPAHPLVGG
jgi:hypothetical protein